jgi:hypothetical protein
VPRSVFEAVFLSAFIRFVTQIDRGFEISLSCTKIVQGCRLTGKPSVSKIEILSSTLSVLANSKLKMFGRVA